MRSMMSVLALLACIFSLATGAFLASGAWYFGEVFNAFGPEKVIPVGRIAVQFIAPPLLGAAASALLYRGSHFAMPVALVAIAAIVLSAQALLGTSVSIAMRLTLFLPAVLLALSLVPDTEEDA